VSSDFSRNLSGAVVCGPGAPGGTEPTSCAAVEHFNAARLEQVFTTCFAQRWRTVLEGGASEPYYQPASGQGEMHRLFYRSDYFASALHEVAHWCIAGERRRQLADFGYWYAPDGRSPQQQAAFEAVEAKPQALEWFFSRACGYRFRISVDNLGASGEHDTEPFRRRVLAQACTWQQAGLPQRAQLFFNALALEFGTGLLAADLEVDPTGLLA
jgi:elongation factor P hydroxylase